MDGVRATGLGAGCLEEVARLLLLVSLVDFRFVTRGDGVVLVLRAFLVSVFFEVSLADETDAAARAASSCFFALSAAAVAAAADVAADVEDLRF